MEAPDQVWLGVLMVSFLIVAVGIPLLIMVGYGAAARKVDQTIRDIRDHQTETSLGRHLEHRRGVQTLKNQRGMPIERLGADLRRLRTAIQNQRYCSATQQRALLTAYDSVLAETCAMLGLEHELERDTGGLERDIERVRIEAMLESRGIVISKPRRHDQNA